MWFRKVAIGTVITVYLLILAGGIVRSTGSGMGCPDWPKCFGSWVPPTNVSQLPADYQVIYGSKLKGEVVFNVYKTWTEYINRLLGVLTGFLIFGTLLSSITFFKTNKPIFWWSFVAFLLVGFQGWLGSKVVSTELSPIMVTLHMLLAIVIVFILIYVLARSYVGIIKVESITNPHKLNSWLLVSMGLMLTQVLIGTQVREAIDVVIQQVGESGRNTWIEQLGLSFYIHRSFSTVVLASQLYVFVLLRKNSNKEGIVYRFTSLLVMLIGVEILSGVFMAYLGIPPFIQPVHLTLAILMLGLQFVVGLLLNTERVFSQSISETARKILS